MDRFETMRVFVRVAARKSFSGAARDFSLPASTVTDAVKRLESRLGVRLLERTTRRVRLTPEGETFQRRCEVILGELDDAESSFRGAKPQGVLRVDMQGNLARRVVLPSLSRFFAEYPGIVLHISETDRFVDLAREGIDCVLRAGRPPQGDLVARQVALLPEVTCASPDYIARFGKPKRWDGLEGHRMIGFRSSATGGILPLEFMVKGERKEVMLPLALAVDSAESYREAARLGLGLIQSPRYGKREDFARGVLLPLLEDTPPSPTPVYLIYPGGRLLSPRVRVFLDWVEREFRTVMPRVRRASS
jgi:DNA-binding transcriptional LysR family regulator